MLTAHNIFFLRLLYFFFWHDLFLCFAAKEQDVDKQPFVSMELGHILFSPAQNTTRFDHMGDTYCCTCFYFFLFFEICLANCTSLSTLSPTSCHYLVVLPEEARVCLMFFGFVLKQWTHWYLNISIMLFFMSLFWMHKYLLVVYSDQLSSLYIQSLR